MSSKFECFVEISDQRYDIVVKGLGLSVKFSEIYPKVHQIVKIALKEVINFITHEFVIFECNSPNIGSIVRSGDHLVNNLSTIRISSKRQELSGIAVHSGHSSLPPIPNTVPQMICVQTTVETPDKSPQMGVPNKKKKSSMEEIFQRNDCLLENKELPIKAFQRIVLGMNNGWNFRHKNNNWIKVSKTIRDDDFTPDVCRDQFYFWTQFYAENYNRFRFSLNPYYEKLFNSLDVIHTLDLMNIFSRDDPTLSQIDEISKIAGFRYNFKQNYKQIQRIKVESKELNSNEWQTVVSFEHFDAYRRLCTMLLGDEPSLQMSSELSEEEKRKASKERMYAHIEYMRKQQNSLNFDKPSDPPTQQK